TRSDQCGALRSSDFGSQVPGIPGSAEEVPGSASGESAGESGSFASSKVAPHSGNKAIIAGLFTSKKGSELPESRRCFLSQEARLLAFPRGCYDAGFHDAQRPQPS